MSQRGGGGEVVALAAEKHGMNIVYLVNKSANALALCHPPSASFCSVLAVQWSSHIFTHDRYNIPSDILIEFEVNLGIIIEKYA